MANLKKEEAPATCHPTHFYVSAPTPNETQEPGWRFSIAADAAEEHNLVVRTDDNDRYYSKDPTAWSTMIDREWPISERTPNCKDLILAMVEAVVSHTTDRESSFASNSPVVISQNWISKIDDCLLPMSVKSAGSGCECISDALEDFGIFSIVVNESITIL
ncbi:unnamed protein product [Dibothriocephalus latus]|uniref:Uncharacterized protein n=1 Tax=Dibothriocephalus latus TaxID=60516 RepID=A0A3P7MCG1_DIBLA|nr:unnamed protein product [Dibothriocephalus latus]